jgi:hypothetical protein
VIIIAMQIVGHGAGVAIQLSMDGSAIKDLVGGRVTRVEPESPVHTKFQFQCTVSIG